MNTTQNQAPNRVISRVDDLAEEVRVLALNLAIYLAKAKPNSQRLHRMEPEFVRLVNGTVKVVQEVGRVVNAARSATPGEAVDTAAAGASDQIEIKLRSVLDQCGRLMSALSQPGDNQIGDSRPETGT